MTALIEAAKSGNADVVNCLLQHGADMHTTDDNGFDALYWAKNQNHTNIVKYLTGTTLSEQPQQKKNECTTLLQAAKITT